MKKNLFIFIVLLAIVGFSKAQVISDLEVIMNVDMHNAGLTTGQPVYISGDFGGIYGTWDEPGTNTNDELYDPNNDTIYSITLYLATGTYWFKFFKGVSWIGGEWMGNPNRGINVVNDTIANFVWGIPIITSIGEKPLANKVAMYPVPFNSTLSIDASNDLNSIILTSAIGLQVLKLGNPGIGTINANTTEWATGLYFVIFYPKSGNPYTIKIMKY